MKLLRSIGFSLGLSVLMVGGSTALGHAQTYTFIPLNNSCGNAMTTPQLFTGEVVSPPTLEPDGTAPPNWTPTWGRLRRGGILYVSANFFRINLTTDRCTYISSVSFGSRVVTPTYTDGFWFADQAASTQPSDPTRYTHAVSVFFPYQPDGSTETVTLTVGRTLGLGTVTYSLPVVRVSAVEAKGSPAPIGISRAELINMFGKALYAKFNGPANSTVITLDDGSTQHIYGYDPSSLSVSVSAANGVGFQFKFKAEGIWGCNPTVRAYGNFKLNADSSGLSLDWINRATASLTYPGGCEALELVPGLGIVVSLFMPNSLDISGSLEQDILASMPDPGNATIFLAGSSTRSNELLVNLAFDAPSIRIQVPYDVFDLVRNATAFPGGETLTLVASGLGVNDYVAGSNPITTLWSGPNGVPRAGTTTWPKPQTLARSGYTVWNAQPVAQLLGRTASDFTGNYSTFRYTEGCSVKTSTRVLGSRSLRFGVNDTVADAQRLRSYGTATPGYALRVFFLNDAPGMIASFAPLCESFSSGPVIVVGSTAASE
jgi:hypothetical protein